MTPRTPRTTLFPYTTLFRSEQLALNPLDVRPVGHDQYRIALECFQDRKSTRLNSSHVAISYAVFCLISMKIVEFVTCDMYVVGHMVASNVRDKIVFVTE